jgi:cytochrome c
MNRITAILVACLFLLAAVWVLPAAAGETVTPAEVIAKVKEAAAFLSEKGEAGLPQFNDPKGPWSWKGTYVFVFDCSKGLIIGHPSKDLVGTDLTTRVDKNGFAFNVALCKEAQKPNGGWVEYWRPTDSLDASGAAEYRRKVSYMLKVPGRPMEVGAGIYEPTLTIDELNKMLETK